MRAQKGETKSKLLGWNGAKRNEGEAQSELAVLVRSYLFMLLFVLV
jgi:hypothetical protein